MADDTDNTGNAVVSAISGFTQGLVDGMKFREERDLKRQHLAIMAAAEQSKAKYYSLAGQALVASVPGKREAPALKQVAKIDVELTKIATLKEKANKEMKAAEMAAASFKDPTNPLYAPTQNAVRRNQRLLNDLDTREKKLQEERASAISTSAAALTTIDRPNLSGSTIQVKAAQALMDKIDHTNNEQQIQNLLAAPGLISPQHWPSIIQFSNDKAMQHMLRHQTITPPTDAVDVSIPDSDALDRVMRQATE